MTRDCDMATALPVETPGGTAPWPFGKGSWEGARALSAAAAFLVGLALFGALVGCWKASDQACRLAMAKAVRLWTLLAFSAAVLEGTVLLVFRPMLLALVLPLPVTQEELFRLLRPWRWNRLWALPYVAGVLVGSTAPSLVDGLALGFYAVMLFRLLLFVLMWVALSLRRVLVPWGWGLAGALVAAMAADLLHRGRSAESLIDADAVFLLHGNSCLFWGVAGCVLFALGRRAQRLYWSAALERVRRRELLDYAFAVVEEQESRARRSFMEIVGGRPRCRRLAFLLEEATGVFGPTELAAVLIMAGFASAGLCAVLGPADLLSTSFAHLTIVTVASAILVNIGQGARYQAQERPGAAPGRASTRPVYALPVGCLALYATKALAFLAVYVLLGLAGAGLAAVFCASPAEGVVQRSVFRVAVTNLIQFGFLLLAFHAWLTSFSADIRSGAPTWGGGLASACCVGVCVLWVVGGMVVPLVQGQSWALHLPGALRLLVCEGADLYLADCFPDLDAFLCAMELAVGPDRFLCLLARRVVPSWPFAVVSWTAPPLLALLAVLRLTRKHRRRAHPYYRTCFPGFLETEIPTGGGDDS